MFGVGFCADDQIIRPLESQGLRRLYPQHYDHKRELKKFNHSILVNFLDLLDILIKAPESQRRMEKIDDLTLLFIHMHHLINEFRPHQARETLRVMMDRQKQQRLETAERFQKHLEKVQELLQTALSSLPDEEALDSKLMIKQESVDEDTEDIGAAAGGSRMSNGNAAPDEAEPFQPKRPRIKSEPEDPGYNDEEINIVDRIMCNIVDTM